MPETSCESPVCVIAVGWPLRAAIHKGGDAIAAPKKRPRSNKTPPPGTYNAVRDEEYVLGTARQYKDAYPRADQAAIEVTLAIHIAHAAAQETRTRFVNFFGLGRTGGRYAVLRTLYLSDRDWLTPNELAKALMLSPASVTFLVDGLEKDGLVTREVSESDGRSRNISLTARGHEVCRDLVPEMADLLSQFLDGFSAEEKATLLDLLMRFLRNATPDRFNGAWGERPHSNTDVSEPPEVEGPERRGVRRRTKQIPAPRP